MIDLDARMRQLGSEEPIPPTPPAELRRRARQRKVRKRGLVSVCAAVVILVSVLLVLGRDSDRSATVYVGPPDGSVSSMNDQVNGQIAVGKLDGVTISVTPSQDLLDGQVVEIAVEGLDDAGSATFAMCSGDVTVENAFATCDTTGGVQKATLADGSPPVPTTRQSVSLSRHISIRSAEDPNMGVEYDCATEPAGCVVAVGFITPTVRGVAVPVHFRSGPTAEPAVSLSQTTALSDGQTISFEASGLRPNGQNYVSLCRGDQAFECDRFSEASPLISDEVGRLSGTVVVWATLYTGTGLVDCTVETCTVRISQATASAASAAVAFADDVQAAVPVLWTEPSGPFTDNQEITLRGSGFRPGVDVSNLGLCPADKDTAIEERCTYGLQTSLPVADGNGELTVRVTVRAATGSGQSCSTAPGCVIGWVVPNGTTIAKVPVVVRP